MRALKKVIAKHERELRDHQLFVLLEHGASRETIARLARSLSLWPLIFQDLLRVTSRHAQGTRLERFATYGREENEGHDGWFLEDLKTIGVEPPSLEELFSPEFQPLRDACHAILAEVHRAETPEEKVAVLVALEPTGQAFFEQVSAAVDRLYPDKSLVYFTRSHLAAEREHDLFFEAARADVDRLVLSTEQRTRAEQMVARVYRAMSEIFTYLLLRIDEGFRSFSDVRELDYRRVALTGAERMSGT